MTKVEHTKIRYVIPEGNAYAGRAETLNANSLGDHLYELQNIPFYAEHLNFEDIVYCDESKGSLPIINRLIKGSGNQTLRVAFADETPDQKCVDIIWELAKRNILYEVATHKAYLFNLGSKNDYAWAFNFLKAREEEGLLQLYEPLSMQKAG